MLGKSVDKTNHTGTPYNFCLGGAAYRMEA